MTYEFRKDTDGVVRAQDATTAQFPITIEKYNKSDFQEKDGRFVTRMLDAHGRPREWQGDTVFIGILAYQLLGANTTILRITADSVPELHRLMHERIVETFFANFAALQLQKADKDTVKRLTDENNLLRQKLEEVRG